MTAPVIEAVANYHCVTGENPLWNERDQRLYWEDIETGRLFRVRHADGAHECFLDGPPPIGGFTFQEDGTLLLFGADRIEVFDPATKRRTLVREGIDPDMRRFNDVIADADGRVFAGTIGRDDVCGGVYRIERDGRIEKLWGGTGCANGMGFSGDQTRLYWTCSTTRRIEVADYDRASGTIANRRVFYQAAPDEGTPDGLAIDADDHLWSARWDGSCVLRIAPDGTVVDRLVLPVPKVSSCAFAGPALDVLYVTTAGGRPGVDDASTAHGTLYRARVGVSGRREFRSRIGI